MKLTQLRLAGQGTWPELSADRFSPELNAFFGHQGVGKTTVAQLASHLLYGKVDSAGRRQPSAISLPEGSVEVESPHGNYVLRRHRDGAPQGRLSIASTSGAAVDSRTIRSLLCDLSPRLLARLYAVDFAEAPKPAALLEGEFAREFSRALSPAADLNANVICDQHAPPSASTVDRARIEQLVQRRDRVALEIEEQMSAGRRESGSLQQELRDVEAALGSRRKRADELHAKLRGAEAKLAEIATTLRYFSLESSVRRGPAIDEEKQRVQLEQLDAEIGRCRQTLSDLQLRDAAVRRELAEVHPDGTADSASCLADQRATVGVLERLLDDLDGEVSLLARSHEPGRCVGCDSHARLSPVAQMLRQQLYTLCGQVTEQERSVRRGQLNAEARQLARAQSDLAEQLEHLLGRRQTIVHESQLVQRPVVLAPQAPATTHCQCQGHGEFVRSADAMLLAGSDRSRREEAARGRRAELQRQRDELRAACDSLQQEIETLQSRWQRLQQTRAQAVTPSNLDQLRAELTRLETEIGRALNGAPSVVIGSTSAPHRRPWKASDALAQLTDGQLVQIRMGREASATVIDRNGAALAVSQLTAPQQDQLYLALTLALVSSFASRGVDLPLFLDEPFLRQDERGAAAMAGVLDEFARQGRQVVVFTASRAAARKFESLGLEVRDIDSLRRGAAKATPPLPTLADSPSSVPAPSTTIKIVRETLGDPKPQLRVAGQWNAAEEEHEVYYLTPQASVADFPVLGNDTAKAFGALGIQTVDQLLAADATDIATRLKRPKITADTVRLWQTHMSLMCFVPELSLNDAQILAANEIDSPEALITVDVRTLAQAIKQFLVGDRGRRFASFGPRFSIECLAELQQLARLRSDRWRLARQRYPWANQPTQPIPAKSPELSPTVRKPQAIRLRKAATSPAKRGPLQFTLDRSSSVERAPSIGVTVAERLAKAGIRTVADLLNANPQSVADELADSQVTAARITRWQCEARLACRIPELRSCGARLLVANGLTEPEQVAGANAAELAKKIRAYCQTPLGQRLLGKNKPPSAARIMQWIRHAAQMRPLEAA